MEKIRGKRYGKRGVRLLAAAVLGASLVTAGVYPALAGEESAQTEEKKVIPDITVSECMALGDIPLPANEYGTLTWEDPTYVPSWRTESCAATLKPAEGVDLSWMEGWNEEEGVWKGSVTVITESLPEEEDVITEEETPDPEEDAVTEEETPAEEEAPLEEETPVVEEDPDWDPQAALLAAEEQLTPVEETAAPQAQEAEEEDAVTEEETPDPETEETQPQEEEETLTPEEQQIQGEINHSSGGITVSGEAIPWYVQFLVTVGEAYERTDENTATIYQSYIFDLWDLKNDCAWSLPDGEVATVTIPVKEGYEYTVEHVLDSGAVESITPTVQGSTMVFTTHSFSSFGIAGTKPVVGDDVTDKNYPSTTPSPTVKPGTSKAPSSSSGKVDKDNAGYTDRDEEEDTNTTKATAVETGDDTPILPFVLIMSSAVVLILGTGFIIRRRNR